MRKRCSIEILIDHLTCHCLVLTGEKEELISWWFKLRDEVVFHGFELVVSRLTLITAQTSRIYLTNGEFLKFSTNKLIIALILTTYVMFEADDVSDFLVYLESRQ